MKNDRFSEKKARKKHVYIYILYAHTNETSMANVPMALYMRL